jgi:hypothetical protein
MTDGGVGVLSNADVDVAATPCDRAIIAVIIPTFNQAHFLADHERARADTPG